MTPLTHITLGMEDGTILQTRCLPDQWAMTFAALAQGKVPATYVVDTLLPPNYYPPEHMDCRSEGWYVCVCGCDAETEGFWPCDRDGMPFGSYDWGDWSKYQYLVCGRCGRYTAEPDPALLVLGRCEDMEELRYRINELW